MDIPHDLPTLRRNITEWLSQSVKHMNQSDSAGIVHCWEKLLAAWEPASAMEAGLRLYYPLAGQLLAAGTLFNDTREAGLEAPTAVAEADEPADTAEGAAEWATAEPEEDEYMQYRNFRLGPPRGRAG